MAELADRLVGRGFCLDPRRDVKDEEDENE